MMLYTKSVELMMLLVAASLVGCGVEGTPEQAAAGQANLEAHAASRAIEVDSTSQQEIEEPTGPTVVEEASNLGENIHTERSWGEACRTDSHGIFRLGKEGRELSRDQVDRICACVQEKVPDSVAEVLSSPPNSALEGEHETALAIYVGICFRNEKIERSTESSARNASANEPYNDARARLMFQGYVPMPVADLSQIPSDYADRGYSEVANCNDTCSMKFRSRVGDCVLVVAENTGGDGRVVEIRDVECE
jgi:hypothetical protein